jgi:hypothetical protein
MCKAVFPLSMENLTIWAAKSAIDLFNLVSASMSTSYSVSASQSQSASTSVFHSTSSSSSIPPLPGGAAKFVTSHTVPPLPPLHPQTTIHSQLGSGSTFNTRAWEPTTHNTTRKKFAEAVSLALEEVTSRGRAVSGGVGMEEHLSNLLVKQ